MNLEQFWELRNSIEKRLNEILAIDRANTKGTPRKISLSSQSRDFILYNVPDQHKELEKILAFNNKVKGFITHKIVEGSGRVGFYEYTEYTVHYLVLREEVNEAMVKAAMHKALKGIMGLSTYSLIDCKLMQLFKDSEITWEACVKAHKTQCVF